MLGFFKAAARLEYWLLSAAVLIAFTFAAEPQALANGKGRKGLNSYSLDQTSQRIEVPVVLNKSETVQVEFPFGDALVGNPEIADVVPLTNQTIYILGKKVGVTRLSLLDARKQVLGVVDIEVTYDLDILRRQLQNSPHFSKVHVSSVNGKVLLTGVAPNAVVLQQILTLAEQLAPKDVTNGMTVAAPQQVMLEVRFIEASRELDRGLGVQWAGAGKAGIVTGNPNVVKGGISDNGSGTFSNNTVFSLQNLTGSLSPFGTIATRVLGGQLKADVFINALEQKGLARRLAEPNLIALSGDTASFLAGGEFPFPSSVSNNGQVSVEFKKFGVGLAFTPTVLADGQINLKIDPEVSELDPNNSVTMYGTTIPGLNVRRATTTIELRDGQSFMIAGLLQGQNLSDTQGLPWVSDVPVLGTLFRSEAYKKKETDLVILVTPRLIRPMVPGDKIATPFDNRRPANDSEFFLGGKQEVQVSQPKNVGGQFIDYPPQPVGPVPVSASTATPLK
jgi:pilus assembly protein CpaC